MTISTACATAALGLALMFASCAATGGSTSDPAELVVQVVKLQHTNCVDMQSSVSQFVSESGDMPKFRVVSDAKSNAILLSGDRQDVQRVLELIARLDVSPG